MLTSLGLEKDEGPALRRKSRGKGQTKGLAKGNEESVCQSGEFDSSCSAPSFLN